jgi:hypothetical protein
MLLALIQTFNFDIQELMDNLNLKKYEQLVKSKKKEVKLELIKRDDFLSLIRERMGLDLT